MNLNELKQDFLNCFESKPDAIFYAPGRVNLIGEHIDYNGGNVFPCTINYGTYALIKLRRDNLCRFYSYNFKEKGIVTKEINDMLYSIEDGWTNYPKGVLAILKSMNYELETGFDVYYFGNIPNGSGLSSSASIGMATVWMINDMYNLGLSMMDCVLITQRVENEYIGISTGIMDQFAIGFGKRDHAILLNTLEMKSEFVPFVLDDMKLLIMNTNKRRDLVDSKYNERREECEQALEIARKYYDIDYLCSLSKNELLAIESKFENPIIFKRAHHVVTENERTLQSVSVLKRNDLVTFGILMNESHESLKNDYEVTGIELDTLVSAALENERTLGARVTGAGFGGCAIALVHDDALDDVINHVTQSYRDIIGYEPSFYIAEVSEGTRKI